MTRGLVFNISEGSIHDGPGLRITVFLKGCMLRCRWCHSPEGQSPEPETLHLPQGETPCGQWYTVEELTARLVGPAALLGEGGGITFSGGDPLAQPEFLLAMLAALKDFHTVVETSGAGDPAALIEAARRCSLIHYGLKLLDDDAARRFTGQSAERAIANLRRLDAETGAAPYLIRLPLLAGITDAEENLRALMALARSLKRLQSIEFLPANPLAAAKYAACCREMDPVCAACGTGCLPPWFDPGAPFRLL